MVTTSESTEEEAESPSEEEMNLPEISGDLREELGPLELETYEEWRLELMQWLFKRGKNPEFGEGYPRSSMRQHAYRIDRFAAWLFSEDGFTLSFSHKYADTYWNEVLKPNDNALSTNRKDANSVALIFKRKWWEADDAEKWSIPNSRAVYKQINKNDGTGFTDWFSLKELDAIKHASLSVYAVPERDEMELGEQEEWTAHLSQRLQKPKSELTDEDWEKANSYKIPSLVYVSCDVGFRPKEVERSRWGWFRLDDGYLSIPKDESTKNSDNWRCYLSDESVRLMRMWKRSVYGEDDEPSSEDPVWTTREGNPYSAESLRDPLTKNLMEEAGIDRTERECGWYMIRRGVGTDLGTRRGLNAVMNQLRITNIETARRYVRHDERGVRGWLSSR